MKMLHNCRRLVAAALALTMTAISVPILPAQAAMVGTDKVIEKTDESARGQVNEFLARDDVIAELKALGISPEEAQARVAALSDGELRTIAGKLETLPSGEGVVGAVIGAAVLIFLVLLVTDLLGFTHVFGFTNKGSARP